MHRNTNWSALLSGGSALAFLAALIAGSLIALLSQSSGQASYDFLWDPYIHRVTLFTLMQAGLSTLLSVALAIPVARALRHRQHRGR